MRFCLQLDKLKHISHEEFERLNWLPVTYRFKQCNNAIVFKFFYFVFFFLSGFFFHRHWRFIGHQGKGGDHLLFHSTNSTLTRTLRHLFATLQVRWVSPSIFNCSACVYQTATRWDLPPYRMTIWLIDWWCNVCLFTWWINSRFFVTGIWHEKPVGLNSHRLSPLCYKRTD